MRGLEAEMDFRTQAVCVQTNWSRALARRLGPGSASYRMNRLRSAFFERSPTFF